MDTKNGTGTSTSCTSPVKNKHFYSNYGFSVPSRATIIGIEIRADGRADSTNGAPKFCVQISWNGGTTGAWASGDFSNASFRVRITNVASNTSRDFSLDGLAVRVLYQR